MELREVIRRRRMCRSFTDEAVDPAAVDRLLDLARRAPSAGHTQGWAWLVLEGAEQTGRFWSLDADPAWLTAPSHPGLVGAPVILVPWSSPAAYRERYREADKSDQGRPGGSRGRTESGGSGGASKRATNEGAASGKAVSGKAASGSTPSGLESWPVPWWDVDTAFAVMLLLLGAVDEGLGALFFALHGDPVHLARAFGVPSGWRPLGAIALGWPAPDTRPSVSAARGRRPLGDVVHRGRW